MNEMLEPVEQKEEEDLVFKPVVRYSMYALALCVAAGLSYATFRLGYSQGFAEGTEIAVNNNLVAERLNRAAVSNLCNFLQTDAADDESLRSMAAEPDKSFEWIQDPKVQREAAWMLASRLLERGLRQEAVQQLLPSLFSNAPKSALWAKRAEHVAQLLVCDPSLQVQAQAYYRLAEQQYADLQMPKERAAALNQLASLLAFNSGQPATVLANLEALDHEAVALGADGAPLHNSIRAYMACVYRESGDETRAKESFRSLEALLQDNKAELSPEAMLAAVVAGESYLPAKQAEAMLRKVLLSLEKQPTQPACLASTLFQLAQYRYDAGAGAEALALLCRAEGVGMSCIAPDAPFWAKLYNRRAWYYLLRGDAAVAQQDFELALQHAAPLTRMQALEGLGRAAIAQNQADKAAGYFAECLRLRKSLAPADASGMGRVLMLCADAAQQREQYAEAERFYASAVDILAALSSDNDRNNYAMALLGQAYNFMAQERYPEALKVFEHVKPMLRRDAERSAELETQIRFCRQQG